MEQFLSEIEQFLARHNMTERTFGRYALNDQYFVRDIRGTRSPSLKTVERVRAFMASYKREAA